MKILLKLAIKMMKMQYSDIRFIRITTTDGDAPRLALAMPPIFCLQKLHIPLSAYMTHICPQYICRIEDKLNAYMRNLFSKKAIRSI